MMDGMPHKHARPEKYSRSSVKIVAWVVLMATGGTSVIYNVWHATHYGHMIPGLALLYGILPVFVAMCMSHVVAESECGWVMKWLTVAVMLGAMALSIGAIGAVVGPTAGPGLRWLFGAVLDGSALLALRTILTERERAAARRAAAEQAEAARQAAILERQEAERRNALVPPAPQRAPAKPRTAPAGKGSARRSAPADDITMEARALELLATDLDMSGAELARRLGVSPGYGRKLRTRLTQGDRGPLERSQERPALPSPDRPADRRST